MKYRKMPQSSAPGYKRTSCLAQQILVKIIFRFISAPVDKRIKIFLLPLICAASDFDILRYYITFS